MLAASAHRRVKKKLHGGAADDDEDVRPFANTVVGEWFVNLCFRVCAWLRNLTLLKKVLFHAYNVLSSRSQREASATRDMKLKVYNAVLHVFMLSVEAKSVAWKAGSKPEITTKWNLECSRQAYKCSRTLFWGQSPALSLVDVFIQKVLFHAYNVLSSRSQREASATRDMKLKVYSAVLHVFMLSVEAKGVAWKAGSKPEITTKWNLECSGQAYKCSRTLCREKAKSIQISVLFVNLFSAEHEKTVEICCAGLVKYSTGKVLFHAYNVLSSRSQREASATRDMKLKVYSAVVPVFMLSVEAKGVAWKAGSKPEITTKWNLECSGQAYKCSRTLCWGQRLRILFSYFRYQIE
ncbi:hypothetical protein F2Q69_00028285 [Brassica cretica]|uniref:Uncharacterized protein n=1 Tax=Brassica cretica TaxID=69181 RepID=A0A8S9RU02_BRACR|nr:hypothetical protein F2Q69_00028285 [Brassica cretica]